MSSDNKIGVVEQVSTDTVSIKIAEGAFYNQIGKVKKEKVFVYGQTLQFTDLNNQQLISVKDLVSVSLSQGNGVLEINSCHIGPQKDDPSFKKDFESFLQRKNLSQEEFKEICFNEKDIDDSVVETSAELYEIYKTGNLTASVDEEFNTISSGFLQITEGPYENEIISFKNGQLFVWGYQLANANLMYHLRSGDKFHVQVKVEEDGSVTLLKAWLGVKSDTPVNSQEFSAWLTQKNISKGDFIDWITDKVKRKPFFPLQGCAHEARASTLWTTKRHDKKNGVLQISTKNMEGQLVAFTYKDLYIHGVRVSDAKVNLNLLMFSVFNVHLQDVTRSTEKNGIDHYGFVYIGERPTELNKKPQDCEKLQQFLEDRDQFDSFVSTWQEVSEGYYSKEDIIKVNIKTKNSVTFFSCSAAD